MPCVKTAQCRDLILASRIQKSKCVVCRTEFYWHTLALSATDSIFWHFTTEEKYKYKDNGEHIENTEIRIHPLPLRLLFAAKPFWDICAPSYTSLCNMALLQWERDSHPNWVPPPSNLCVGSMMVNGSQQRNAVESSPNPQRLLFSLKDSPRWVEPHIMADRRGKEGRGI